MKTLLTSNNHKKKAKQIITILSKIFPLAKTDLTHNSPFQLLVATMLSAQCTDKRVNIVTPNLFSKYPTTDSLANATTDDVESIIKSTGFYKNKTKNIIQTARQIVEKHNSIVPLVMDELTSLPGVGRKTANCVIGNYAEAVGIVVDTHVIRITNLLGLVKTKNAEKIEDELMTIIEKKN